MFSTQESPRGTRVNTRRGAGRPEQASCRETGKTATEKEEREGMGESDDGEEGQQEEGERRTEERRRRDR